MTVAEQTQLGGMQDKKIAVLSKLAKEVHELTAERLTIHTKEREKRSALHLKMDEYKRKVYRVPGTNIVVEITEGDKKLSVRKHETDEE